MRHFNREWIVFGPSTGHSVEDDAAEGLYLIYCDDPKSVKIGISGQPLVRTTNLSTGSPSELHLFFYSKLLGRDAETHLHRLFADQRRSGEWFEWTREVQGFLLGMIFGVSGVLQVSWPFSAACDRSQFVRGIDWIHAFLDPDGRWTLRPMTGMGGEEAFDLFQDWNEHAKSRNSGASSDRNSSACHPDTDL